MNAEKEIREEALKFLRDNTVMVMASTFDGQPSAAALYYAVDDDFTFYFITKRSTLKYQNILMNPRVGVVVGAGPSHITLQAHGEAKPLSPEETEDVLGKFRKLETGYPPKNWPLQIVDELKEKSTVLFKIIPHDLKFMNLTEGKYPRSMGPEHHKIV